LRAPLALTPSRFWRSLKPPRSPTTGFDPFHLSRTRELTSPGVNSLPRGRTVTDFNEARHTVAANALDLSCCRVALKSETRRFRHRVLPLIARFGCHGAFASRPPLCNVTNCGKQTWHRSPTLLLSTEGNRVFAIIFHRHLQHKSLTPVSGLRAKISELRAKSHI
jgi:hypothetical protein